jgi:hypothetical protein
VSSNHSFSSMVFPYCRHNYLIGKCQRRIDRCRSIEYYYYCHWYCHCRCHWYFSVHKKTDRDWHKPVFVAMQVAVVLLCRFHSSFADNVRMMKMKTTLLNLLLLHRQPGKQEQRLEGHISSSSSSSSSSLLSSSSSVTCSLLGENFQII